MGEEARWPAAVATTSYDVLEGANGGRATRTAKLSQAALARDAITAYVVATDPTIPSPQLAPTEMRLPTTPSKNPRSLPQERDKESRSDAADPQEDPASDDPCHKQRGRGRERREKRRSLQLGRRCGANGDPEGDHPHPDRHSCHHVGREAHRICTDGRDQWGERRPHPRTWRRQVAWVLGKCIGNFEARSSADPPSRWLRPRSAPTRPLAHARKSRRRMSPFPRFMQLGNLGRTGIDVG